LIRKALEEHGLEGEVTHIIDGQTAIAFIEALTPISSIVPISPSST
jgi:ribosomal protein L10